MVRRTVLWMTLALSMVCSSGAWAAGGEKGDIEAGIFAGYGFPDRYEVEGGPILDPENDFLWGVRLGYFFTPRLSVEGSYQMFATNTDPDATPELDFDIDSLRANLLLHFRPGTTLRPFLTVGLGREEVEVEGGDSAADRGLVAGAGLNWFFKDRFSARLDGRWIEDDIEGFENPVQNNYETTLGLSYVWGGGPPPDGDGDGVPDRKDKCPGTPAGAVVDEKGCPKDGDGDGVFDGLDKCPDTPKGHAVDASGCSRDSDRDGVNDAIDKCPGTPAGATVDATGCPKDSDGDGVFDGIDKCPGTPKGTPVDEVGCTKDTDGDGVPDGTDKCPGTPRGTKVDATGCPPPAAAAPMLPEREKPLVLEGVTFAVDTADLTPSSTAVLDRVAASMRDFPDVRIEIEGHTDSSGSEAHNSKLSQARAESVMTYLANRGVAASRMTAKGHGESKPIADNTTKEGKAKNRRVELRRIE